MTILIGILAAIAFGMVIWYSFLYFALVQAHKTDDGAFHIYPFYFKATTTEKGERGVELTIII